MDKCDDVDGLKDGLIDDPRTCSFDPARDVPACSAGADAPDCLTAAQAATIKKIYGGPVSKGKPLFPGYMPGSEAVTPGAERRDEQRLGRRRSCRRSRPPSRRTSIWPKA